MSFWIVLSWVMVAVLTGINIFVFLKLKSATEQMLKMAFPGAKDMKDALAQMQKMMGAIGAMGLSGASSSFGAAPGGFKMDEARIKAAMNMLQQFQNANKKQRR